MVGKRSCQKRTFRLINKVYEEYLRRHDNLFLLFIDSDCILDKVCIQNFMYEMELKPGSKRNMLAMTGVITSTTAKNSFITVLQDMEYVSISHYLLQACPLIERQLCLRTIRQLVFVHHDADEDLVQVHGQLFERSVESGCGAVTCLPGALTILRFSAFRRMARYCKQIDGNHFPRVKTSSVCVCYETLTNHFTHHSQTLQTKQNSATISSTSANAILVKTDG